MKILTRKLLAVLAAASATLAGVAQAEVILPSPAEQVALNPRISLRVDGDYPTSFLISTLANVPAGYSVKDGKYAGWCVDSNVPIHEVDVYEPILYSSYEDLSSIGATSANWGIVNYIINQRTEYAASLGATASEIQDAIWNFVGGDGIGQEYLEAGWIEGFPPPNLTIVQQIIDDAGTHADFEPGPGQFTAIVLDLGDTAQRTIIEVVCPSARLGSFVWRDDNHNGIQDADEPGIAGVTVILKDTAGTVLDVTVTDPDGLYAFEELYAGDYVIEVDPASPPLLGLVPTLTGAGTTATDSNASPTSAVLLPNVAEDLTYDFGFYPLAAPSGQIGNFVWKDLNANGRQDPNEPGINGVTVTLEDELGTVLQTVTTAGNGEYLFTGLPAGTYVVKLSESSSEIAGFIPTVVNAAGTNAANDSNLNPSTVTLATNDAQDLSVDFGFIPPGCGCIGNWVWKDINGNGKRDCNEPGIRGVTVKLYWNGVLVNTDVTDSRGSYTFWGLWQGCYEVVIDNNQPALADLVPTKVNATWNKWFDSNPNPAPVCLASYKSCDMTINFGYKCAPTPRFCTRTLEGWGCAPRADDRGRCLEDRWDEVYPDGCVIGGSKWLKFSSFKAVKWFMPCGRNSGSLRGSYTDATSGHGTLSGHCLALKINVDFSDSGVTKPGLRDCKFKDGKFAGQTVGYLLSLANQCLGGGRLPAGIDDDDIEKACATVNKNYDGGNDGGKLLP